MPTYEYECRRCGHRFEKFQRINDAPLGECPDCGGDVRRLISRGGGIVFRGSGFYATDYGSGKGRSEGSGPSVAKGNGGSDEPAAGKDGADDDG